MPTKIIELTLLGITFRQELVVNLFFYIFNQPTKNKENIPVSKIMLMEDSLLRSLSYRSQILRNNGSFRFNVVTVCLKVFQQTPLAFVGWSTADMVTNSFDKSMAG